MIELTAVVVVTVIVYSVIEIKDYIDYKLH